MRVVAGNAGPENSRNDHWFTWFFGEMIVAIYNIVVMIVLLNLMIAMICNTAGSILVSDQMEEDAKKSFIFFQSNEDTEWKYVRCHIWVEFFEENNAVPPPMNILYWFLLWIPFLMNKHRKFKLWPVRYDASCIRCTPAVLQDTVYRLMLHVSSTVGNLVSRLKYDATYQILSASTTSDLIR